MLLLLFNSPAVVLVPIVPVGLITFNAAPSLRIRFRADN